jgi:leucyl aminopeptidase (aminopeptidase T)
VKIIIKRTISAGLIILAISATLISQGANETSGSLLTDTETDSFEEQPVDYSSLARQIVEKNAGVRKGERVWIKLDGDGDSEFVDALAVAVGRAGGHPVVTSFSNALLRGWYREVPDGVDARPDPWLWRMYRTADVLIEIDAFDYTIFGEGSEERYLAWEAANGGVIDLARERGMRIIRFGNNLYPSTSRAAMLGISEAELAKSFWPAVMVDPLLLSEIGERLRAALEGAQIIRITDPNGTDLTMQIATQSVVVTDGTTNRKPEPGELNITWLPGGEVTLGIDPESVHGRLFVERVHFDGEELRDLLFNFEPGRRVAIQSKSDLSRLRVTLDSAPPGLDGITGLKIGINPDINDWRLLPHMGSGIVSVSLGANRLLGGDIDLPYILFLSLNNANVTANGFFLIENGELKL